MSELTIQELDELITAAFCEMGRFPTTNCKGYELAHQEFTRLTTKRYEIIHGLTPGTLRQSA